MPLVNAFTSCPLLLRPVLIRRSFDCRRRLPQNLRRPHVLAADMRVRVRDTPLQERVGRDVGVAAVVRVYISLKIECVSHTLRLLLRVGRAHVPRCRSRPHRSRSGGQRRTGTPALQSRCSCTVQGARLPPHLLIQAQRAGFVGHLAQVC